MRRTVVLLAALSLLAALAACGGKASAAEIVRAAPAKSQNAKTAKIAVTTEAAGKTVTADGTTDFAAKKVQLSMDTASLGLPGGGGKLDIMTIGTDAYVKIPPGLAGPASQLLGGKPFLKIDMQAVGESQGLDLSALEQGADPAGQLDYLKGAANDVKEAGTESIRGVKTTHYKATIDLNKAEASMTPAQRKATDALKQKTGITTIPVEVWVDAQGRARRMWSRVDMTKASGAAASVGYVTTTIEFYDYGTPVQITAPPADQVADLTSQVLQGAGAKPGSKPGAP